MCWYYQLPFCFSLLGLHGFFFSHIDIVERFQLSLMLIAVAFRNLIELSGSEFDFTDALVLPQSFGWSRRGNIVWRIFSVGFTSRYLNEGC